MSARPSFQELLAYQTNERKFLCVGLDIGQTLIPSHFAIRHTTRSVVEYAKGIIDATKDYACAFKPNVGFYFANLEDGIQALCEIREYAALVAPDVIFVPDPKLGDIKTTSEHYEHGYFGRLDADAITLNPYMGQDSLQPFLDHPDKGCLILCKTSNPGSRFIQDRYLTLTSEEIKKWELPVAAAIPVYEYVAHEVSEVWNIHRNCGLVVGATFPEQMKAIRSIVGDDVLLFCPGVGKQGADLGDAVRAAKNSMNGGFMINSSSSIDYASAGTDCFEAAGAEAKRTHEAILSCL
jgi:orotidine-5'-phosphate decarboxylase